MSYIAVRADADEARIRHELSGNLCRCTGASASMTSIEDARDCIDASSVATA